MATQRTTNRQRGGDISFRIYRTTNQALSAATFTKVALNTVGHDLGNDFDEVTNYRFTARLKGVYSFTGNVGYAVGNTRALASIYQNGSEIARSNDVHSANMRVASVGISDVLLLKDDYVELFAWNEGGNSVNGLLQTTYLTGHLVTVVD